MDNTNLMITYCFFSLLISTKNVNVSFFFQSFKQYIIKMATEEVLEEIEALTAILEEDNYYCIEN